MTLVRIHTKLSAFSCAAVLCACATQPTPATDRPIVDRVRISNTGDPNDIGFTNAGPSSANAAVEFAPDRVWSLLPSVYSVLTIPVSGIDSVRKRIVGTIRARRSFRDEPVSRFLDCGHSLVGANADLYSVAIRLTTQVDPTGPGSSRVRTLIDAAGTNSAGATTRCSSTGALEAQIVSRLREGLSR